MAETTGDRDFAAHQPDEFPRDREPEARALPA